MIRSEMVMPIVVRYSSVDGCRMVRRFKRLKGAREFAHQYVGRHPEIGSCYAVSADGIGKIEVFGASLADLFGDDR